MESVVQILDSATFGNILNIVGLVITIIGFALTIRSTWKSREASIKAREEVAKVREDMRKIRTVADFSSALTLMEEIKRLHRDSSWQILPDRYSNLKNLIVSVKSANGDLRDDQKAIIQNVLTQLTNMENQVERHLMTKQNPPDITRFNSIISKQVDNLREILVEVQNRVGG